MFATFSFITLFAVLGVWARYGQTLLVQTVFGRGFPWATLSINVLGCFLMGFLFFETLERISVSPELRTGMLIGGLGTYTTFSTFSLETLVLFENGETVKGLLYMFTSLFLCVGATFAGAWISRSI